MAQIKEILETERENKDKIYLYREGLFYKAYERSAYLWVHKVCGYEVKCRYVKVVNKHVASIGFPHSALKTKISGYKSVDFPQGVIVTAVGEVSSEDFDRWKRSLVDKETTERPDECREPEPAYRAAVNDYHEVIDELRRFPIETSSPIDCMMLVSRLKQML